MKTARVNLLAVFASVFLFNIVGVFGKTWYVDDDLVDYPMADFSLIQDAVNSALDDDTILVYPGIYHEFIELRYMSIKIISFAGANETIINPAGIGILVSANEVTIAGFTFQGTQFRDNNPTDFGIQIPPYQEGNKIIENNTFSKLVTAVILEETDSVQISNNVFSDNIASVFMYKSSSNLIENNNITNIVGVGILLDESENNIISNNQISNYVGRAGIYLNESDKNVITYNQISNYVGPDLEGTDIENEISAFIIHYSNNNDISFNTLTNHSNILDLNNSANNWIYCNNFLNYSQTHIYYNYLHPSNFWNSPKLLEYQYGNQVFSNYLGNYWDTYAGNDIDQNGIGDSVFYLQNDALNFPVIGVIIFSENPIEITKPPQLEPESVPEPESPPEQEPDTNTVPTVVIEPEETSGGRIPGLPFASLIIGMSLYLILKIKSRETLI